MEKVGQKITRKVNKNQQLYYTEEFKKLFSDYKKEHLLSRFRKLLDNLKKLPLGSSVEDGGLKITSYIYFKSLVNKFFKVEYENNTFFLKVEERWHEKTLPFSGHNAIEEIDSSAEARKLLQGISGVEVVDFQIAFRDSDRSYFVSRWRNLPNFYQYLEKFLDKYRLYNGEIRQKLEDRLSEIKNILEPHGFKDLNFSNVFYDESNDKVILYDLHRGILIKN